MITTSPMSVMTLAYGGAVANIVIMAEMQYAHINREICQRYGLQRTDNAI